MSKERLADLPDDRNALVGQAADWYSRSGRNIPAAYIEKDFWVTEVLRSLSTPLRIDLEYKPLGTLYARVIFKGGTSLSKAHGLIERFSEDIDLYVVTRFQPDGEPAPALPDFEEDDLSKGRADQVLQALAARVNADIGREVVKDSDKDPRTGTRRAYRLHHADEEVPAALRPHVLIELTRMGNPEPNAPHQLRSMVHEFVETTGVADADFAEFEPITVDVLMPHRTLVEKLYALESSASMLAKDPDALSHMARHFYDVHQLLLSDSVMESLAAEGNGAEELAGDHVARSKAVRRDTGPRPDKGFAHSYWIVDAQARAKAKDAYEREVPALAYGKIPEFDTICALIEARAEFL